MTNEQLAVFLSNYRDSIGLILEALENSLPDELFEFKKDFIGVPYKVAPILDDLKNFHSKLCDDVEALKVDYGKVGDV